MQALATQDVLPVGMAGVCASFLTWIGLSPMVVMPGAELNAAVEAHDHPAI